MQLIDLLSKDLIILNLDSKNKLDAIKKLVKKSFEKGLINNEEEFLKDVLERESLGHTALESSVATPHAKSKYVIKPHLIIGINKEGIDFSNGEEVKSKLLILIAIPENMPNLHIDVLTKLANFIGEEEYVNKLVNSNNLDEVFNLITKEENNENKEKKDENKEFIVAVTACPTGIAHTFMARDALNKAAKELGVEIKIETNGTDGRKNEITEEDLKRAKGVILAINKSVDEFRFNGSQVIKVSAKDGINKAKQLIQDILDNKGNIAVFDTTNKKSDNKENSSGIYSHLMSGVSYMLPLVISGGIIIALAFLADTLLGFSNSGSNFGSSSLISSYLMKIGGAAFSLFIPILGGYIAYSIAQKNALAAGLVAGSLAVSGGSGFLGAIFGGLIAGYITKKYSKITENIPSQFRGANLILFTPVLTVLITGLIMMILLNPVVGQINTSLTNFLNNMDNGSKLLLGILVAGMMAVDMGGPINKAAYVFGTGTIASTLNTGGSSVMAAVMAGGMVPPLAIALATTIFKNKYSKEEREAGFSNYVMGLSFITEGAIPFAAANPLRVIPACVIGSSVAGALTMLFNIKIPAPHGGILVMFLSNNFILYSISIIIGSIVSAILLAFLKKNNN